MPYFPTYQEMQDALEHARLKMWHTHGKVVDFGGPEFVLYALEGLGEMEAPKILDEPIEEEPTKVTVTKSFGVEADTQGSGGDLPEDAGESADVDLDREAGVEEARSDGTHEWKSDRGGKNCLECGEPRDHEYHQGG